MAAAHDSLDRYHLCKGLVHSSRLRDNKHTTVGIMDVEWREPFDIGERGFKLVQ